jgi:L-ribulose-5-phosphate 4-epimerase
MELREARAAVLEVAKRAAGLGLVPYTTGNFSLRDAASGRVVITPSALRYDLMTESDLLIVDQAGHILEGNHQPSTETPLHLSIYADRPDIHGVIHTHSPYLTCFAALGMEIPAINTSQYITGPKIPVAPCTMRAIEGMPAILEKLRESPVVLFGSHGAVATGPDLELAFRRSVMAEHFANVYHLALQVGKPKIIAAEDIKKKMVARGWGPKV